MTSGLAKGLMALFFLPLAFVAIKKWLLNNGDLERFRHVKKDDKKPYFERLGELDRLRWLVQEAYMSKFYSFKTIDDTAYQSLVKLKGCNLTLETSPPNYNILQNEVYREKMGLQPTHMPEADKDTKRDEILVGLYGLTRNSS